jgi:hypothetical protein
MSAIIESSMPPVKTVWGVRNRDGEEDRELERLRAASPLTESPLALSEETVLLPQACGRKTAHLAALNLGLSESPVNAQLHSFTFNVRTALEVMWEDISDMEERTERITRQAHLAMLVARVKQK